ncbi:MAG: hypothetical protein E6J14_07435 [Chloroflexi bacterium]|nr:MAG: hypothetical protein E6J14_07435 [Chloroflexota bacterium]
MDLAPLLASLALLILLMTVVWVVALVDVAQARDTDPTTRPLLAALLIFVAPVGLLAWALVRGPDWWRALAVVATLGTLVIVPLLVIAAASSARSHSVSPARQQTPTVMVERAPSLVCDSTGACYDPSHGATVHATPSR